MAYTYIHLRRHSRRIMSSELRGVKAIGNYPDHRIRYDGTIHPISRIHVRNVNR